MDVQSRNSIDAYPVRLRVRHEFARKVSPSKAVLVGFIVESLTPYEIVG